MRSTAIRLMVLSEGSRMPDVIKLDIEGAEFLALNGAGATLSAPNAPQLFIEFHPQEMRSLGGTLEHCLQLLQEHGYRRYEIVEGQTALVVLLFKS